MQKTTYVLCIPITPDGSTAVGITKLKGPAFLLNKVTFPGGRVEPGESPREAAVRELSEEVGITVGQDDAVLLAEQHDDSKSLYTYLVVTPKARYARQLESEPVWLLDCQFHLEQAARQAQAYAPDFLSNLESALALAQRTLRQVA